MSAPSFIINGPTSDACDECAALARAWAVQVTDPATTVDDDDYSSKQWALWAQEQATAGHNLDSHTDVVITTPQAAQVLTYNGTNWINLDSASGAEATWPSAYADPVDWIADVLPVSIGRAVDELADRVNGLETQHPEAIIIACSDETTAISAGTSKVTFRMPYAMTLTAVRASLTTAQVSGASVFTVDVNKNGVSVLSTQKIAFDNGEKTSTTSSLLPFNITGPIFADDSEITIDVDQIGDGTAKGLKVSLIGYRS